MRQFHIDDSSVWAYRYGDGKNGSKNFGSETIDSGDGAYYSALAGLVTELTASTPSIANGTYGLPCIIIQMMGSVPTENWELNYLISVSGGVGTFLYPLQNNYGQSGTKAQIITANAFSDIALSGTLSMPAWNGTTGGVGFLMGGNIISGSGNLNGYALGFRGGSTTLRGEGTGNDWIYASTPNGNGAGGGTDATSPSFVEGGHSGGGGNRTAGDPGSVRNANAGQPGQGGLAVSTQNGKTIVPGGGSGGAGLDWDDSPSSAGVAGSGLWITIARRQIWTGGVSVQGVNGVSNSTDAASGAGAPGGWVAKGQEVNVSGTINLTKGIGGTCTGAFGGKGGDSGEGIAHIDYSGTTTAGVDSTQSSIYADQGGALMEMFL